SCSTIFTELWSLDVGRLLDDIRLVDIDNHRFPTLSSEMTFVALLLRFAIKEDFREFLTYYEMLTLLIVAGNEFDWSIVQRFSDVHHMSAVVQIFLGLVEESSSNRIA